VSELDTLLLFWAKRKGATEVHYPLLYHMLDVAAVAQAMWDMTVHPELRQFFARQLGLGENEAGLHLSFWAGLHDLGKALLAGTTAFSPVQRILNLPKWTVLGGKACVASYLRYWEGC